MSHVCKCGGCDYTVKVPANIPIWPDAFLASREMDMAVSRDDYGRGLRLHLDGKPVTEVHAAIINVDGCVWRYVDEFVTGDYADPGKHVCQTCWNDACIEKLYGNVEFKLP